MTLFPLQIETLPLFVIVALQPRLQRCVHALIQSSASAGDDVARHRLPVGILRPENLTRTVLAGVRILPQTRFGFAGADYPAVLSERGARAQHGG